MSTLQVGDLVLVPIAHGMREIGTVLQLFCELEDGTMDGVLVKAKVSGYKDVYRQTEIEAWKPEQEEASKQVSNFPPKRNTRSRVPLASSSHETPLPTPSRNTVTPSPHPLAAAAPVIEHKESNPPDRKPAAKRKRLKRKVDTEDDGEQVDELPLPAIAAKKPKKHGAPKKPLLIAHPDSDSSASDMEDDNTSEDEDNSNNNNHEANEVVDREEKFFTVEYSPSGRATCRRCDEVISKNTIRVSHVPLFRGKPGFRIYRHLDCATFDTNVKTVQDVGGWQALKAQDQQALLLRIQESLKEIEQEEEELQPDELVQESFAGEMRSPPKGLTASLLPFQVEGVSWMYCQEVNTPAIRGGILADEMGMGKTLQTIVSMLDNRPILQHSPPGAKHPPSSPDLEKRRAEEVLWAKALEEWKHEMDMNNVPEQARPKGKKGGIRAGTLIVCPVVALSQWKSELEKFTDSEAALSVGIYHGPKRASEMPLTMMHKYDVVLTTYQVLEQDFRKMVSPNKVACPNCGGKFKISKLKIHLKYFCGENAQRTEAQARQRRTAEQDRRPNRGGSSSKKKKTKVAPQSKALATEAFKSTRLHSTPDYDSESDISLQEDLIDESPSRPTRSAAIKATKKVKGSLSEWSYGTNNDADSSQESTFSSNEDSDSSDSESDRPPVITSRHFSERKTQDEAVQRALKKQKQALEQVKKVNGIKKARKKKSAGKATKGKGKKKFDDENSSDSSDGADSVDPMDGIDMDDLIKEAIAGSRFSALHSFCWWRIVLDEAHMIKSRASQTSGAAFALTGIHRWCLSGTPLQNRVGELYSLIRFLRIEPMAYYFCRQKDCTCKSLHYRMTNGICQDCGHRSFSHFAHFNKYVLNPIQRDGYSGDGRRAMFKLKNEVLDKCLLRRTKETKAADLELPPRLVTLRSIRLHPIEEDFYNALYTQTKSSFDDYVAEGTLLNNYAHIFDLLTKMRQAVNHPYLIVHSKTRHAQAALSNCSATVLDSVDCEICHEPPTEGVSSSCCNAAFCRSCVLDYISGAGGETSTPCPCCREPFTIDLNQESPVLMGSGGSPLRSSDAKKDNIAIPSLRDMPHVSTGSILRRINLADFATSTKIEVLVQELIEMRRKRPGSKALVFSQFVNMLDLVRWRLHSDPYLSNLDLGVKIMHGGMDVKSRDAALKTFREDHDVRVLLMSLKSAGVALNLTAASEVYLLDLWWNPAAEMQALDRVHRIGQHRPIRAVRFVAEGTVEERVLQLQEKKRLVFDGTVGRDAGSLKMLAAEDMKALFT